MVEFDAGINDKHLQESQRSQEIHYRIIKIRLKVKTIMTKSQNLKISYTVLQMIYPIDRMASCSSISKAPTP